MQYLVKIPGITTAMTFPQAALEFSTARAAKSGLDAVGVLKLVRPTPERLNV